MRVAAWNLNRASWSTRGRFTNGEEHLEAAWGELALLGVDLALVQEAAPPPDGLGNPPDFTVPDRSARWRSLPGSRRSWCSAVASWERELTPVEHSLEFGEPLHVSHEGSYAVGAVSWRGAPLTVASIYALWDYAGLTPGERPLYAETSLHRTISDLTPVIDARRRRSVIVGGDFNASTQFSTPHRDAYRVVHERMRSLGLVNLTVRPADEELEDCPCEDEPCLHVRTYDIGAPYQNDYIYATPDVAAAARFSREERSPVAEAVSDHFPVVVDIED